VRTIRNEHGSGDLIAYIFFVVTSVLFITLILLMGLSTRQAVVPSVNRIVDAYSEKYARYGMRAIPNETLTVDAQLKSALAATGKIGDRDQIRVTCGRYIPGRNGAPGSIIPSARNASSQVSPDSVVRAGDLVACAVGGNVRSWTLTEGDIVGGDYFYMSVKTATIGDKNYVG
jgi:hypothetical protein